MIAFDNRGVGATGGKVPTDIEQMGADAIAFIRALGHEQVDLIGFSLGGAVAQMVALQAPDLVRRMVVAGSGPRGGGGIWKMPFIVGGAYAKAFAAAQGPAPLPVLPAHHRGQEGGQRLLRAARGAYDGPRQADLLAGAHSPSCARSPAPGMHATDDLARIKIPVFVANGDNDLMVASEHSKDMAARLPDSRLRIYPDSGHGGVFQYHHEFVPEVLDFLGSTPASAAS